MDRVTRRAREKTSTWALGMQQEIRRARRKSRKPGKERKAQG
jgi:hypothetical protein